RLDDAITAYETYLAKVPHDLGVQLRLAGVLREAGRSEEAAIRLAKLAEVRPDKVKVKLALADTLDEIGSLDRAKSIYS
ncbi:tetratricopeptide repeat protein, partial [Klebsiella pneumoniae]|uniref:tetratricopeptide repeat protein n=2 Tax=Pseudomonadota TaxID=1224 RepID=UPI00273038DD